MDFKFSVIIPIHNSVSEIQLKESFDSVVISQFLKPTELILVIDGFIEQPKLRFIKTYASNLNISSKILFTGLIPKGPGYSRNLGAENAKHNIIAFMDSDDVSMPDRFIKQIPLLERSNFDLVGGQIEERDETLSKKISVRSVPLNNVDIYKEFKYRNPINNVTVAIRKKIFLDSGGYPELFFGEDYILWLKMTEIDCNFKNLDSILVRVRTGKEFLKRRFTSIYFKRNLKLSFYLSKFKAVGMRYSALRMFKVFIISSLPSRIQYYMIKRFTRDLE